MIFSTKTQGRTGWDFMEDLIKKTTLEDSSAVRICSRFLLVVKVLFSYFLDYLPAPSKT